MMISTHEGRMPWHYFLHLLLVMLVSGVMIGCGPETRTPSRQVSPPSSAASSDISLAAGEATEASAEEEEPADEELFPLNIEEADEDDAPGTPVDLGDLEEEMEETDLEEETDIEEADPEDLVPFVPTPPEIVEAMLRLADVKPTDVVYDLGCGDGRILFMAAQKFGAKAVGIELNPELYKEVSDQIKALKLENKVAVKQGSFMKEDFSGATVVTLYLMPDVNDMIKPRLKKLLKPGTRIVSHDFPMSDWEAEAEKTIEIEESGLSHTIYLYKL